MSEWVPRYVVAAAAFSVLTLAMCQASWAQDSQAPASDITLQNDVERGASLFHKDMFGKSCLTYEAVSRALATNTDVYQHIISVDNHCHETIAIHLCYWHTERCKDMQVPASRRKVVILGVRPFMKRFRYEAKEIFKSGN